MHRWSRTVATMVASVLTVATLLMTPSMAASAKRDLWNPYVATLDRHGHLWVTDSGRHGVTEFDAASGRVLRVVNAAADGFNEPIAITAYDDDVWIVNGGVTYPSGKTTGNSVTELNEVSGALVRVVHFASHGVGVLALQGITATRQHVWITAAGGDRVIELNRSSGAVQHTYRSGSDLSSAYPDNVAVAGGRLWIPSPAAPKTVVERSAVTGRVLRRLSVVRRERAPGQSYRAPVYASTYFVTLTARDAWFAEESGSFHSWDGGGLVEVSDVTGKIVRFVDHRDDAFMNIRGLAVSGQNLWVANGTVGGPNAQLSNSLTVVNATTGRLVRVLRHRFANNAELESITAHGDDLWVVLLGNRSRSGGDVEELNATTGTLQRTYS